MCILALLVFHSVAVGEASAQTAPAAAIDSLVSVNGEAVVKTAPDRAWVSIGSESRSRKPKEAQAQNAVAMTAVQQKLQSVGISRDAIRTVSFDLQLEVDWVDGRQVPRGYVARNSIEVRVDDIARVGEILDAAVGTGATSVHGVRFDLKERERAEREALRLAVADARARAEAAAAGAGMSLGRIVRIEEPGVTVVPPQPMMMARAAMAEQTETSTPVAPGEIEVRARVTLTASLR